MAKINKVIFLLEQTFSLNNYNRLGIEIIQRNGFEVEVWDFVSFLQPPRYREAVIPDPINYKGYRLFLTPTEALTALSQLEDNCFIIPLIHYDRNSYSIYRMISRKELKYCLFMVRDDPGFELNYNNKNRVILKDMLNKITPNKLFNFIFFRLPKWSIGIRAADMILAGGGRSLSSINYNFYRKSQILWLHSLDYDAYLEEKDNNSPIENKRGVFLDGYGPFHSDYFSMGVEPSFTPQEYYSLLCKFFDFIENTYGFNIVIAAHPRSYYEKHPDYFTGRPVIRGQTCRLVKNSAFTIAHSSTSVNFCVLFNKPIIFITTNKLKQSLQGAMIEQSATLLGKKALNLNDSFTTDFEKELIVDEEAYASYKNAYIKRNGSPDLPFWQMVTDYLKRLR